MALVLWHRIYQESLKKRENVFFPLVLYKRTITLKRCFIRTYTKDQIFPLREPFPPLGSWRAMFPLHSIALEFGQATAGFITWKGIM